MAAGARQGRFDVLADDEMRTEKPHRLPDCRPHRRQADPAQHGVEDGFRRLARMNDANGDAERPRRGRYQERGGFDVAVEPAAGGKLVFDQPVGGGGVGNAQQRFGQHHERQAFLGRQRIGVQKVLDATQSNAAGADRLDQPPGARIDAAFGGGRASGIGEEPCRQRFIRRSVRSVKTRQLRIRRVHAGNLAPRRCIARRKVMAALRNRSPPRNSQRKRASRSSSLSMLIVQPVSMPCR